jgi:hypothetical protein
MGSLTELFIGPAAVISFALVMIFYGAQKQVRQAYRVNTRHLARPGRGNNFPEIL